MDKKNQVFDRLVQEAMVYFANSYLYGDLKVMDSHNDPEWMSYPSEVRREAIYHWLKSEARP
jgi:hypothetical protein